MLSSFLDFFFKNCISFNSSHFKTLPFLPFEGNTFLFWCCIVIIFWLLLLFNGKELMLRFALIRYALYVLSSCFKLFFSCFLLYRMSNYAGLLVAWEYYLHYVLVFTAFSGVTFVLLQVPLCLAIYNLTTQIYTLMGLSFCLKFVLSVYNSKVTFTMLLQNEGLILLPFVAEALLCFTFAACFHSLFLLSNKNNESVYFMFIGTVLLIFCGFFTVFSNNISSILFPISGCYFGFIMVLIITQWLQNKQIMWSLLFYTLGLAFAFFKLVMPLILWSSVLAESLVFFARTFYTYNEGSDEFLACLYLALNQTASFANWQQHISGELLKSLVLILALLYSVVSYNMLTKDDDMPSLTQLHISMLFILYFCYTGVIVLGPTAYCMEPEKQPFVLEKNIFKDRAAPSGSADLIAKYSEAVPPVTVEAITKRTLVILNEIQVGEIGKKVDTTNKHLEYWSNSKNRRDAAINPYEAAERVKAAGNLLGPIGKMFSLPSLNKFLAALTKTP